MQLSFDHPYLHVTPVSSSFRSHFQEALPLRRAPGHASLFEFFTAMTVSSLWRSLLPRLAAIKGSVREATKFSQPPQAKPESQTLLSSNNLKISSQAGQGISKKHTSPERYLWATAMSMLCSSEPRSIPFSETYMMCRSGLPLSRSSQSFAPLRQ